jgi:hypothetical protein
MTARCHIEGRYHSTGCCQHTEEPRKPVGDAFTKLVVQASPLQGCCPPLGLAGSTGQTSARWRVLAAVEDAPLDGGADRAQVGARPSGASRHMYMEQARC